jgi:hypothetical protein
MQIGEYEIRRPITFRVEFDGRIAAVTWEESSDKCKTQKQTDRLAFAFISSHVRRSANSTLDSGTR